jgi:hypothetical protein
MTQQVMETIVDNATCQRDRSTLWLAGIEDLEPIFCASK